MGVDELEPQDAPDEAPWQLYDWKRKVYLRVLRRCEEGLLVYDPRGEGERTIRAGQIGPKKRYRAC